MNINTRSISLIPVFSLNTLEMILQSFRAQNLAIYILTRIHDGLSNGNTNEDLNY